MGNSKKQKTRHLTEDEIWDDSALVRSWDEAVAEYEYYHSIHARNEDVEEVLRQAEIAETTKINVSVNGTGTSAVLKTHGVANEEMEDGEVYDEQQTIDHVLEEGHPTISPVGLSPKDAVHPQSSTPQGSKSSPDQTLENIKLAYWWAGYYSGLYEGRRQPAQPSTTSK